MADLTSLSVPSLASLVRRVKALEVQAKFNYSARNRVSRAGVDAGENFIIRGLLSIPGSLSLLSTQGADLLRLGDMAIGRGIEMLRNDGTLAFLFAKPSSESDPQAWGLYDRTGTQVVAENPLGAGLARPFLNYPFQPVAAASGTAVNCGPYGWERTLASTSWTTMFVHDGKVQNPFLDLKLAAKASDDTTSGEIQVVDANSGTPLPGFGSGPWVGVIPAGTTALTVIDPTAPQVTLPTDRGVGAQMRLGIQLRRTAGAGTLTLSVAQAIGGTP